MADETMIANGVGLENDDQTAESFDEVNQRENEIKLKQKVEALEKEKLSLANENEEIKAQILQLSAEIESLRSEDSKMKLRLEVVEIEREQFQESKKALEAIATRALQLETEVSRLQHDLISAMAAGEDANAEISQLKSVLGEKEVTFEQIRREKVEVEEKMRDLERKLGLVEVREIEEKSNKMRIEEEMKEKIDEKEKEMVGYKKKFQTSEAKVRELEERLVEMQKKVEEAEKVTGVLKERSVETANGFQNESVEKETKRITVELPVLAIGLTGAVLAAAAVAYVGYARRS